MKIKKKTKLTETDKGIIKKCTKASDDFNNLKNMNANTAVMAEKMPKLLEVVEKLFLIIDELEGEKKVLKDAGGMVLDKVKKTNRQRRNQKHNYWNNNHHPDALN